MAGEIYIADKITLDLVKTNSDTTVADTALIKTATAAGSTTSNNLNTQAYDESNLVVSLTGKYELLGIVFPIAGATATIQIDGATNRKSMYGLGLINLVGMGIKCDTSMAVYCSTTGVKAIYRLLP